VPAFPFLGRGVRHGQTSALCPCLGARASSAARARSYYSGHGCFDHRNVDRVWIIRVNPLPNCQSNSGRSSNRRERDAGEDGGLRGYRAGLNAEAAEEARRARSLGLGFGEAPAGSAGACSLFGSMFR
jgi:hypothetical protein